MLLSESSAGKGNSMNSSSLEVMINNFIYSTPVRALSSGGSIVRAVSRTARKVFLPDRTDRFIAFGREGKASVIVID